MKKLTLLISGTMTVLAGAAVAPSLPGMAHFFEGHRNGDLGVKMVLTLPGLFTAIAAPWVGLIADRLGRKGLLVASAILYGLAGSAGTWLESLEWILVSRALLGVAVGGIMTMTVTLIADYYDGKERQDVMGKQAAFMGFGGVLYFSLGGVLADVSWRTPFGSYLAVFMLVPLIVIFIEEPRKDEMERLTLDRAQEGFIPWGSVVPMYALALFHSAVFYMIPVHIPFLLDSFGVASSTKVGFAIAGFTLLSAMVSMCYGRVKSQFTFYAVFALSFALMAIGYLVIANSNAYLVVLSGLMVAGLGMGLWGPNLNVVMSAQVPGAARARVMGGLTTCLFLGQFLSPLLTQPIIHRLGLAATYGLAGAGLGLVFVAFTVLQIRTSFS